MIDTNIAYVDLQQLVRNYTLIREAAGRPVLCVVKANAYGHGAQPCAQALREAGAEWFGVATLAEALELRKALPDAEILLLGYTPVENAGELRDNRITQTVYSLDYARQLSEALADGEIRCHLKLDTGMNRLGFRADRQEELEQAVQACRLPHLHYTGMFTHFACADEPENPAMTLMQSERFAAAEAYLADRGLTFPLRHVSNSAAVVNHPALARDMVRGGILLYGFAPSPETGNLGCRPIMTLVSRVSHVHTLHPGDSVGYGATFTADRPMTIATLPIGYADGFVRAYAGGKVLIEGQEAPLVGRICMDQCTADVTSLQGIGPGSRVEVFGPEFSAQRFADLAGTIPYEVTSIITPRVKRIYP